MCKYYIKTQPLENGDYEIHREDCLFIPLFFMRKEVGDYSNPKEALEKAQEMYKKVNGCQFCTCDIYHEKLIYP